MPTIPELEKTILDEEKIEHKLAHDLDNIAGVMEADPTPRQRKTLGNDYILTASGVFSARVAIVKAKIEIAKIRGEPIEDLNQQLKTAEYFLKKNDDKLVKKGLGKTINARLEVGENGQQLVKDKRGNLLGVAGEKLEPTDLLHFGTDGKLYKVKKS